MKRTLLSLAAMLFGATTILAQGSGTTSTATTSTATTTKKSTTYQTVKHVNGVVTARSEGSITVKGGSKTRKFTVVKSTKFVGTRAAVGAKVKVAYRSSAPGVAVEVRKRS